jgi:hypothetical protein
MDTRFWGPPGWKLLHLTALNYPNKPSAEDKINYGIFYSNLKDVLPCKYCRKSFTKYIANLPVEDYLESKDKLFEWVYLMHNKVNGKLRRQGLIDYPDPSLEEVKKLYPETLLKECQLPGWDFIYSIVFNYNKQDPPIDKVKAYSILFTYLGKVIPCRDYRELYNKYFNRDPVGKHLTGRDELIKWLYNINCCINGKLKERNRNFHKLCTFYETFRAGGCNKTSHKGYTCRKRETLLNLTKATVKRKKC